MKIEKIGIIAMFNISRGGGAPRVTIDLINALNSLGKKVYLLTPFKLNQNIIKELYDVPKIDKIYHLNKLKTFFCRGRVLPRKLMKNKFQRLSREIDLLIDIDGGIVHKYLPQNFPKEKYVIWRISTIIPESKKLWIKRSIKRKIKERIQDCLGELKCHPNKNYKIYAINKWTSKELKKIWGLDSEKIYLYPEIKVDDFLNHKKKKDQILVFGRIAPNKSVIESLKIFNFGASGYKNYKLIIMGGATSDTKDYIKKIIKKIKEFGIEKRVKIIPNPSFEELKKILSESKILITSQKENSMTMTSLEAMAAGCIVLNHKYSGGYLDILDNGKYGYGFSTLKEGADELKRIIKNLEKKKINNKKSIKRAKDFSPKRFRNTLNDILKEIENS